MNIREHKCALLRYMSNMVILALLTWCGLGTVVPYNWFARTCYIIIDFICHHSYVLLAVMHIMLD